MKVQEILENAIRSSSEPKVSLALSAALMYAEEYKELNQDSLKKRISALVSEKRKPSLRRTVLHLLGDEDATMRDIEMQLFILDIVQHKEVSQLIRIPRKQTHWG